MESLALGRAECAAVIYGFIQTLVHAVDASAKESVLDCLGHAMASTEPQRKSVPLIHILCRITASFRASAITARR